MTTLYLTLRDRTVINIIEETRQNANERFNFVLRLNHWPQSNDSLDRIWDDAGSKEAAPLSVMLRSRQERNLTLRRHGVRR